MFHIPKSWYKILTYLLIPQGLSNLTFLELSENRLSVLEVDAVSSLSKLQTLRLRGNKLSVNAVSALEGMHSLQELDLSDNLLAGPLGATTLPALPGLRVLQLAHNQLSSVRRGALTGFASLVSLTLHHNQIDVLEDNAFSELRTLTQLDLAHNRIVAVSGNSLAHLTRLVQLDLAHNFLRALTADLVVPLRNLQELRLDDNDISMVTSDALNSGTVLRRLTLAGKIQVEEYIYMIIEQNKFLRCFTWVCYKDVLILHLKIYSSYKFYILFHFSILLDWLTI